MVRALSFIAPAAVLGQFGGPGGGFGGGYQPPAPICPAFSCGKGKVAVGKPKTKIISYGCKDSGMNILSMADFDASNPMGGMNRGGKNLNKCCIDRDICKQTCGMSSKQCHDAFQKCQTKICAGDQNCNLQAMMSDMSNDPFDSKDEFDADKKYDPEESKCKGFKNAQTEVCQCVAKDDETEAHTNKLKEFYSKFNPEKLDDKGDIKDVEDVWKKWKGKERDMFVALATKYKEKVVEIKEKPKPAPYKPPVKDEAATKSSSKASSKVPKAVDAEFEAFEVKLKELTGKKEKAKKAEDFDEAQEMKDKIAELKQAEVDRLTGKKEEAVAAENYAEAKNIKARIGKIEL